MLAPLRRCVDGWPCMVGDLRGRKMRTGVENQKSESYNFYYSTFCVNVNRAAYKCRAKNHTTSPASALYSCKGWTSQRSAVDYDCLPVL